MVLTAAEDTFYAVPEPAFSVAVGIDHMLRSVFFSHIRKSAPLFKDAGGRIMQEHDEFSETIRLCQFKGSAKPDQFPGNQFLRVFLFLFVPSDDPAPAVQIKRSFKGKSFRSRQRIVPVDCITIL